MTFPYVPAPQPYAADPVIVSAALLRADVDGLIQLLTRLPAFAGHLQAASNALNATNTPMPVDTTDYDPYGGHFTTGATNPNWYPPVPGWYLAEGSSAFGAPTVAGSATCGITYVSNGGAAVFTGGGRAPLQADFGTHVLAIPQPVAARLVQIVSGLPNRAGTDYVAVYGRQSSGSTQSFAGTSNGYIRQCTLAARWIAAQSGGVAGLTAPAEQPPPNLITAAWLRRNLTQAIQALTYPPFLEYSLQGNASTLASQAAVPAVGNTVVLDTPVVDSYSAYSASTGLLTVPAGWGGNYYLFGQVDINTVATSQALAAGLTITSPNYNGGAPFTWWSGALVTSAAADDNCATVRKAAVRLNPGDTVALAGFQRDSGSNAAGLGGTTGHTAQCRLIAIWQGV